MYTKLPAHIVEVAGKQLPDIRVDTPHKGIVTVKLTQKHYPFLFGSATQTDRYSEDVVRDLYRLETEATDFLLEKWKEGRK